MSISGDTPLNEDDTNYIKTDIAGDAKQLISVDLGAATFENDSLPANAFDNDATGAGGNLDNLREIILPSSLKNIGDGAFYSCANLRTVIIPESVTSIGDWAFAHSGIEFIRLPESIDTIRNWTFYSCNKLQRIQLPGTLKSIGNTAFAFSGLRSLVIPASVSHIGNWAFRDSARLQSVLVFDINTLAGPQENPLHRVTGVSVFYPDPDKNSFWPETLPSGGEMRRVVIDAMPSISLAPNKLELKAGSVSAFSAPTSYGSATSLTVSRTKWLSSSPNIATVDSRGKIRAVTSGKTVVTCVIYANATITGTNDAGDRVLQTFTDIPLAASADVTVF